MTSGAGSPTSSGDPRYSAGSGDEADDGRMIAPSAARNLEPITSELTSLFAGRTGPLLEIGSGTGQHAACLAAALPGLIWIPSDPAPAHRRSINAWRDHLKPPNMAAPIALDAVEPWWMLPEISDAPLTGLFCANVIHISPWAVAEGIIAGAGKAVGPGGLLILYGPFRENGAHTGEGNERFDLSLRAQNPDWGIRDLADVAALAAEAGFPAPEIRIMPSNNRMVIFTR